MKIVSVNVGTPAVVPSDIGMILTAIYKSPVNGPVAVRTLNLAGDRQADLKVHGGIDKAVYAYPSEHYAFWRTIYPDHELAWGAFGENLTTEGLDESVSIGDQFRIGTTVLQVTQPRLPCFKLATKFEDEGIGKTFKSSGRSGFYLSVIQEGVLQSGDLIEPIHKEPANFTIADALRLYLPAKVDRHTVDRALQTTSLPHALRERAKALKGSR